LAGAEATTLANPLPYIASDAAAAFIRFLFIVFKGSHGLGEEPRLVTFLLKEKKKES
jgi:hypothetical protein